MRVKNFAGFMKSRLNEEFDDIYNGTGTNSDLSSDYGGEDGNMSNNIDSTQHEYTDWDAGANPEDDEDQIDGDTDDDNTDDDKEVTLEDLKAMIDDLTERVDKLEGGEEGEEEEEEGDEEKPEEDDEEKPEEGEEAPAE